jgi:hypothetical protein
MALEVRRAVLMPVAIGAVEQDSYPPRVLVSVTGLTLGDDVEVFRVVAGVRTALRAGAAADVDDTAFLVLDAELPFGIPVSYVAVVNSTTEYATSAASHTLPGGNVVVSDAVTGTAAEVMILAWPFKRRDRAASVFRLATGETVVVSGPRPMFAGTIELYVETDAARAQLDAVLATATANTVQIRQPGGYSDVDCYVSVLSDDVRRWSQDGTDQRRIFALDVAEVSPWASDLEATGYTYQDLEDVYAGLDYTDLTGDYATYLDLAQAELIP